MSIELGQFAPGIASCRKLVATPGMSDDARWKVFANISHEIAGYVARGLDRITAVDVLHDIAEAQGWTTDEDEVQGVIADAFAHIPEIERVPDGIEAEELKKGNGHDAAALVPLHRPFPLEECKIPPRDWVIPGLLMRKQVTVLVAPSGSGKSLLTLQVGIACALGEPWAGWRPRNHYRVLFINSEDDKFECQRRLAAMARVMRVGIGDEGFRPLDQIYLQDRFFIADEKDGYVVAAFDARTKTLKREPMFQKLVATIHANKIDLVFVDPFAETFAGDENSNSELKWAGMLWRELARQTNVAVCLVHHTKKYATGMAGDVDAARGAGALIGIARIVSTLFPMSGKEAEVMKNKDGKAIGDDRHKYLRYDDAKANLNLKSSVAKWFEKKTITLDNANMDNNQPGDEVGALVHFTPPGLFDTFTVDLIDAFFVKLEKGIFDSKGEFTGEYWTLDTRKQSENEMSRYVGDLIMSHFSVDLNQALEMIKAWQKAKRIAVDKYRSKRQRKERNRVMPAGFKAPPEEQTQDAFI